MIVPTKRFRAFTLIELLIAVALVGVFSTVISVTLANVTDNVTDAVSRAEAEQQARLGVASLSRLLEGARPLGACDSGTPNKPDYPDVRACRNIIEFGPAFEVARPDKMVFYTNWLASSTAVGDKVLRPLDRIVVTMDSIDPLDDADNTWFVENRLLTARVYAPASGQSYTSLNPERSSSWSLEPVDSVNIGVVRAADTAIFEYFDAEGNTLTPVDPVVGLTKEQRLKIAMVAAKPTFNWDTGDIVPEGAVDPGDFNVDMFASVSSKLYGTGG